MTIPVIPEHSRKGKLNYLLANSSSTLPKNVQCCICQKCHGANRWKKCSFTLTEFGIELASLMMERKLIGNICCNSAYVVLWDFYYSQESSKKVHTLKVTKSKSETKPKSKTQPQTTNLVPILPKGTIITTSTIVSPLESLHNQVEKDFAQPELTQKEKREISILNINDPSGTLNLNLKKVFECFNELKPPSFTLEMGLKEDRKYPLHIRYKVALLFAKFDLGSQNIFDVLKLIANLPEFGNIKISDSMSHDTVLRCVTEMALCVRAAIALLMSESTDLIWSCDETEDSSRRFLVFTIHGVFCSSQWHFVVRLTEIIEGTANSILNDFKELLKELNKYQYELNRNVTKS